MLDRALNQNFIPVVDDQKNFIGIITRKEIIKYFYQKMSREGTAKEPEISRYMVV